MLETDCVGAAGGVGRGGAAGGDGEGGGGGRGRDGTFPACFIPKHQRRPGESSRFRNALTNQDTSQDDNEGAEKHAGEKSRERETIWDDIEDGSGATDQVLVQVIGEDSCDERDADVEEDTPSNGHDGWKRVKAEYGAWREAREGREGGWGAAR